MSVRLVRSCSSGSADRDPIQTSTTKHVINTSAMIKSACLDLFMRLKITADRGDGQAVTISLPSDVRRARAGSIVGKTDAMNTSDF